MNPNIPMNPLSVLHEAIATQRLRDGSSCFPSQPQLPGQQLGQLQQQQQSLPLFRILQEQQRRSSLLRQSNVFFRIQQQQQEIDGLRAVLGLQAQQARYNAADDKHAAPDDPRKHQRCDEGLQPSPPLKKRRAVPSNFFLPLLTKTRPAFKVKLDHFQAMWNALPSSENRDELFRRQLYKKRACGADFDDTVVGETDLKVLSRATK
jgi:hypothetical protein